MIDITASDLLHMPHVVICEKDGDIVVLEYPTGEQAHIDAMHLTDEFDRLTVCVRVRTLSKPAQNAQKYG